MTRTKIRKEQIRLTLNDLLVLDREFAPGTQRKLTLNSGERLVIENGDGVFISSDLTVTGNLNVPGINVTEIIVEDLTITGRFELNNGTVPGTILMVMSNYAVDGNSSELFWDLTNRRLGIGTGSPTGKLHIFDVNSGNIGFGGADQDFWFDGGSDGVFRFKHTGASGGRTSFMHGNTELMTITNNGKVGINTTNPTEALHVVGNVRLSDKMGIGITGAPSERLDIHGYDSVIKIGVFGFLGRFQRNGDTASGISFYTYLSNNARHVDGADENTFLIYNQHIDGLALTLNRHGFRFLFGDATDHNQQVVMTELARLTNDGKLGLGTTSPSEKLQVIGNVLAQGDFLSNKTTGARIGTITAQDLNIITNNINRIIIPSSNTGEIVFYQRTNHTKGLYLEHTRDSIGNSRVLNSRVVGTWFQYTIDHGVNGWGSWNPSTGIGVVFLSADYSAIIVSYNGQILTQGTVSGGGDIVGGDYVFINATNPPFANAKALVLAFQPQLDDVVKVIGVYYYEEQ